MLLKLNFFYQSSALGANHFKISMQERSLIHLSHHSISLIQNNPQKYLEIYLEQKKVLLSPQATHRFEIGSGFHLVIKQMQIGLPVTPLLENYPKIKQWIQNLKLAAPHIFSPTPENTFRECEYPCNLMFKGCLLCCVYDMVIVSENEAHIIEWTTANLPFNAQILNWEKANTFLSLCVCREYELSTGTS